MSDYVKRICVLCSLLALDFQLKVQIASYQKDANTVVSPK